MKILYDFQDMTGGAPRSQLAHMLVMKANGHEVIATIGKDFKLLKTKAPGVKVIKVENFRHKKIVSVVFLILSWVRLILKEKPDLIHTNRSTQSRFVAIASDFTGTPMVFSQAGGVANPRWIKNMVGKTAIVYSYENKAVFVNSGFNQDQVFVVSNRVPNPTIVHIRNEPSKSETTIILITGNIKKDTINGLLKILKNVRTNAKRLQNPFVIKVAGKDFSSNQEYYNLLETEVEKTNIVIASKGYVQLLGWVEDIEKEQASADICVGKGRSVIQAAFYKKICFVLSEEGVLTRLTKKSFKNLYHYNFSGRGPQTNNNDDFINILQTNNAMASFTKDANDVCDDVKNAYSITYAYGKLLPAYHFALGSAKKTIIPVRLLNGVSRFFSLYSRRLFSLP